MTSKVYDGFTASADIDAWAMRSEFHVRCAHKNGGGVSRTVGSFEYAKTIAHEYLYKSGGIGVLTACDAKGASWGIVESGKNLMHGEADNMYLAHVAAIRWMIAHRPDVGTLAVRA